MVRRAKLCEAEAHARAMRHAKQETGIDICDRECEEAKGGVTRGEVERGYHSTLQRRPSLYRHRHLRASSPVAIACVARPLLF